jgi:hypothetical protein
MVVCVYHIIHLFHGAIHHKLVDFVGKHIKKNTCKTKLRLVKSLSICPSGFTGIQCETDIDECASAPCQNGAVCNNLINYYTCSCPEGFTGRNCEISMAFNLKIKFLMKNSK